jgi:hypothetical protein
LTGAPVFPKLVRDNRIHAVVAQLVERELPKLEVAGSRPVRRLKRAVNVSQSRGLPDRMTGLGQSVLSAEGGPSGDQQSVQPDRKKHRSGGASDAGERYLAEIAQPPTG